MWILRLEGIDIICRWVRRQRGREDTTSESVMHGGCVRSEVLKGGITLVLTLVPTAVISTYWMMCGELGFINNSWFVSSPEPERRASLRHEPIKTTVQSPRGPPERLQTSYIQIIQYGVLFFKRQNHYYLTLSLFCFLPFLHVTLVFIQPAQNKWCQYLLSYLPTSCDYVQEQFKAIKGSTYVTLSRAHSAQLIKR